MVVGPGAHLHLNWSYRSQDLRRQRGRSCCPQHRSPSQQAHARLSQSRCCKFQSPSAASMGGTEQRRAIVKLDRAASFRCSRHPYWMVNDRIAGNNRRIGRYRICRRGRRMLSRAARADQRINGMRKWLVLPAASVAEATNACAP